MYIFWGAPFLSEFQNFAYATLCVCALAADGGSQKNWRLRVCVVAAKACACVSFAVINKKKKEKESSFNWRNKFGSNSVNWVSMQIDPWTIIPMHSAFARKSFLLAMKLRKPEKYHQLVREENSTNIWLSRIIPLVRLPSASGNLQNCHVIAYFPESVINTPILSPLPTNSFNTCALRHRYQSEWANRVPPQPGIRIK